MSDTRAAMRDFRFLDEKRNQSGLSPAEEQRWLELRTALGIQDTTAEPYAAPQGYYGTDGNWYPYPAGYDPNAYAGGYDPNAQGYYPQGAYDPNAGQYPQPGYDPNAYPGGYDPNAQGYYPQEGYDPNAGYYPQGGYDPNQQAYYPPQQGYGEPYPAAQEGNNLQVADDLDLSLSGLGEPAAPTPEPGYIPAPTPVLEEPAPAQIPSDNNGPMEVDSSDVMEVDDGDVMLVDSSPSMQVTPEAAPPVQPVPEPVPPVSESFPVDEPTREPVSNPTWVQSTVDIAPAPIPVLSSEPEPSAFVAPEPEPSAFV
ncbi:MAG: hypothetical protein ACOZIN_20495, partial [Myxococcota bacterium]